MAYLFSCFIWYSFLGFFIEIAHARVTRSKKLDRKCFLLLPLCPVYGFGALAILALPPVILANPILLLLAGGLATTAVEYLTGLFYDRGVGVNFWDYSSRPRHLSGYVCLEFTGYWSVLSCLLYYGLHPLVSSLLLFLPGLFLQALFIIFALDSVATLFLLHLSGSTDVLKWYAPMEKLTAEQQRI